MYKDNTVIDQIQICCKLHIDQLVNLKTTGSHGKAVDIIVRTVKKKKKWKRKMLQG